jgi:hypothetical protein
MYKPVAPVVMAKDEGDDRPLFGPSMIAARAHGLRVDKGTYTAAEVDGGVVAYWLPEQEEGT